MYRLASRARGVSPATRPLLASSSPCLSPIDPGRRRPWTLSALCPRPLVATMRSLSLSISCQNRCILFPATLTTQHRRSHGYFSTTFSVYTGCPPRLEETSHYGSNGWIPSANLDQRAQFTQGPCKNSGAVLTIDCDITRPELERAADRRGIWHRVEPDKRHWIGPP
jgi:hypothetical protein